MDSGNEMQKHIFSIIDNQIKGNDPPETKVTYDRLLKMGYDDFTVKQLIGMCLSVELFEIIQSGKPFDKERYVTNLKALPKEPPD